MSDSLTSQAPSQIAAVEPRLLEPVQAAERIDLLDVLRGFALLGVLLSNLETTSGESIVLTAEQAAALPTAALDAWALGWLRFFVNGKFITLFTVLFGVGFAVQMERAAVRGGDFSAVYRRRLGFLLLIGLLHICVWWGDILHYYALLGFVLLWASRFSDRLLLWSGVVLAVMPYTVVNGMAAVRTALGWVAPSSGSTSPDPVDHLAARLAALTEGNLIDIVGENFAIYSDFYSLRRSLAMACFVFGYFLLGLVLGRRKMLQEPSKHLPFFRRLLMWGAPVGLLSCSVMVWGMHLRNVPFTSLWILPTLWVVWIGVVAMTGAYLATFVLLMQRPAWHPRLLWLAPVGRMALSNYLMHSVFYLLLLDRFQIGPLTIGFGWLGHLGAAGCIGLSMVLFLFQVLLSRYWLQHVRFGPAEWLWRSLTYGQRQPWWKTPS